VYDFLFVIIELFSIALTVDTLQAEICRRERFLKGVGHSRWKRTSPTSHCWVAENYKDVPFIWYNNITGRFFGLVTKHACDRQTDRITTSKTALA